jgi:molecular chaperone DnaK
MYAEQAGQEGGGDAEPQQAGGDDIVDAEFEEVDDDKKD